MKQLESNFEDDVTVTTIRKVTEFSVDDNKKAATTVTSMFDEKQRKIIEFMQVHRI